MSAIFGVVCHKLNKKKAVESLQLLSHRGRLEGVEERENIFLGHRRELLTNGKQPFVFNDFIITFNGLLYNADEIKKQLKEKDYKFTNNACDAEIVVKLFAEYGQGAFDKLEGMFAFAIWNKQTKQLFMCRDKLGLKPLFYYFLKSECVFASELKAILHYKSIYNINHDSLKQVLALGPSRTPNSGIYPNVHELRGGHYAVIKKDKMHIKRYWQLQSKAHEHNFKDTVAIVKNQLHQSIENTLKGKENLSVLLSGGLDSTIITLVADKLINNLTTYSVDYAENNKYFKGNEFQVSSDNEYIALVRDRYNIKNIAVNLNNEQLLDSLESALYARDYPGMVDVDGSLYQFAKAIKNDGYSVIISGEGADEIFGGYPWFYREKFDDGFPWIRNAEYRHDLLNDNYKNKLQLQNYVQEQYDKSVAEVPLYGGESRVDKEHKVLTYLNLHWFMQTLIERKDRMTMASALQARLPFADTKLVEYLYNVPWDFKYYNNMEKGLLREATNEIVPEEILYRKKSPYPKTFNPKYYQGVKALLTTALNNKNSILHELFDATRLNELLNDEKDLLVPWFGQLMTKPQLIAYLYQIHLWFEKYNLTLI